MSVTNSVLFRLISNQFIVQMSTSADHELSCRRTKVAILSTHQTTSPTMLTPVAVIPTRSSLRASSNGNLFLPRTERRFGDRAFSVAAPRVWNRLPTELKLMRSSTTTFKRHLKTFLFNSLQHSLQHTPPTDYTMRHRTNCRRRTTNAAVTVTVRP